MPPSSSSPDESLMEEHRDFLRALARSLVRDEHRAEDVVQEAWLTALERAPEPRPGLRRWLARVVRNLALRSLRREGERPAREARAARPEAVHDGGEEEGLELQQRVVEAVRGLRQPYRSTVYQRYYRGLSPRRIAAAEGVPLATVKTRLRRGLELLREELDRRTDGGRREWTAALVPFAALGGLAPGAAAPGTAQLLKGLVLMNKSVAAAGAVSVAVLASVLWIAGRDPAPGGTADAGALPGAAAAQPAPEGGAPLAGAAQPAPEPAAEPERAALAQEAAPAEPAAGTAPAAGVRGRVVDDLGRPVAGARVELGTGGTFYYETLSKPSELDGFLSQEGATTDAEGRFELPAPAVEVHQLSVAASGFAPFRREVDLEAGAAAELDELVLDPGVYLAGHVVDAAGLPVAGVEIRQPHAPTPTGLLVFGEGPRGRRVGVTGDDGSFLIDKQAVGPWSLLFLSPDHPASQLDGQTERAGQRVEDLVVALEPGFEIHGRLAGIPDGEADGKNLEVRARPGEAREHGDFRLDQLTLGGGARSAPVEPDGTFRLRGLRGGQAYRLRAYVQDHGDHSPFLGGSGRSGTVKARAGDRGVELRWSSGAALVFRVADARIGEPLTDFEVAAGTSWLQTLDEDGATKTRHPGGRVRFENLRLPPGHEGVRLRVRAHGYAELFRADIRLQRDEELDLGVLHLHAVPLATVVVRDADSGEPVEGARVTLAPATAGDPLHGGHESPDGPRRERGTTDAEGRATLTSFPGRSVRLSVRAEGYAPARLDGLVPPEGADFEQEVRLAAGGTVAVRVVDRHGEAVEGARVERRLGNDELRAGPPGEVDFTTDSEGEVLFRNLAPGTHYFRLDERPGGYSSSLGFSFDPAAHEEPGPPAPSEGWSRVDVAGEGTAELVLEASPRGLLFGTLTEAGVPLAGATLRLSPADGPGPADVPFFLGAGGGGETATAQSNGYYSFDSTVAGRYRLTIKHRSRAMPFELELELAEGANERDLDLDVAIVRGRVSDLEGGPLEGVRVTAERVYGEGDGPAGGFAFTLLTDDGEEGAMFTSGLTEPPQEARTDAEGRYELRGVAPGTSLRVEAHAEAYAPGRSETFEVEPFGLREGVDLELAGAGSIEVSALRADGSPAPDLVITAVFGGESEAPVDPRTAFLMGKPAAVLGDLRPGPWRVSVQPMIFPGQEQPPEIEPQTAEVVGGGRAELHFDVP